MGRLVSLYSVLVMGFSPADYGKTICVYSGNDGFHQTDLTQVVRGDCSNGEVDIGTVAEMLTERQRVTRGRLSNYPDFAHQFIHDLNK